jgi:hypothetical protein
MRGAGQVACSVLLATAYAPRGGVLGFREPDDVHADINHSQLITLQHSPIPSGLVCSFNRCHASTNACLC